MNIIVAQVYTRGPELAATCAIFGQDGWRRGPEAKVKLDFRSGQLTEPWAAAALCAVILAAAAAPSLVCSRTQAIARMGLRLTRMLVPDTRFAHKDLALRLRGRLTANAQHVHGDGGNVDLEPPVGGPPSSETNNNNNDDKFVASSCTCACC